MCIYTYMDIAVHGSMSFYLLFFFWGGGGAGMEIKFHFSEGYTFKCDLLILT